jgi:hypothetical protein
MTDDGFDLETLYDPDDEPPRPVPPIRAGTVLSGQLPSGQTWRVAVVDETVRLTIATHDGMATLVLPESDIDALSHSLNTAGLELARNRREGRSW